MTVSKSYDFNEDQSLSDKWKFRFSFFEKNGPPGFWTLPSKWKAAFKEMSLGEKRRVNANVLAFFFSAIYLLILGLWKKAILVFILNLVAIIAAIILDVNLLGLVVNLLTIRRTNLWYYELKVKGIQTWSL